MNACLCTDMLIFCGSALGVELLCHRKRMHLVPVNNLQFSALAVSVWTPAWHRGTLVSHSLPSTWLRWILNSDEEVVIFLLIFFLISNSLENCLTCLSTYLDVFFYEVPIWIWVTRLGQLMTDFRGPDPLLNAVCLFVCFLTAFRLYIWDICMIQIS